MVTVEDGGRSGGVGAAITDRLAGTGIPVQVLALPQQFLEPGSAGRAARSTSGLTAQAVARGITEEIARRAMDASGPSAIRAAVPSPPTGEPADSSPADQASRGRRMRVLVVEDARRLADAIARGLRAEGMAVDVAYDGLEGHQKSTLTRYDVVVLDRDLPEMHGDDLLAEIVAAGDITRVLMLTASAGVDDRVDGLSLGADDYLSKPFAFPELVARVRALGRRATPAAPPVLRAR